MNKKQINQRLVKMGLKKDWNKIIGNIIILTILIITWSLILISILKIEEPVYSDQYLVQKEEVLSMSVIEEPVVAENATVETVEEKIIRMSKEYRVDTQKALRIAECESQFGKYYKNWEGSSAKGVYQFIDKTWDNYCEGDVLNEDDNIKCFMELYNKYPHWWACN